MFDCLLNIFKKIYFNNAQYVFGNLFNSLKNPDF